MTEYQFLYVQPWTDRLGWTLLHFLWQGALIACVFGGVRALLATSLSPRARYGLACCALALMAAAPVATFLSISLVERHVVVQTASAFAPPVSGTAAELPDTQPGGLVPLLPWTVALWLAGALACSLRLAGGWFVAARLRFAGHVLPAPTEWQRRLDTLAGRIGVVRPVRVLVSSLAQTPMAVGHLRPVVLIPLGTLSGIPAEQLEALLAHELAHIWRHDYLTNLLQSLVEALLFYHPAVWWVSRQIRIEREICCDDVAVAASGDRVVYAHALAAIESFRPAHRQPALAASGGDLLSRIRRLADPSAVSDTRPGLAPAVAVAFLLFISAAAATVGPTVPAKISILTHATADAPIPARSERAPSSLGVTGEPAKPPRYVRALDRPADSEMGIALTASPVEEPIRDSQGPARNANGEPIRNREPNPGVEPTPRVEPNARVEGDARIEPNANREPNVNREPYRNGESYRNDGSNRNGELNRNRESNPEGRRIGFALLETREPVWQSRVLSAIEIRGLSDMAGNDLLSRLPVHEGDTLASNSLELVGRVARSYGEHIEYSFVPTGSNEAVLRIHPAGLAGAALLNRK